MATIEHGNNGDTPDQEYLQSRLADLEAANRLLQAELVLRQQTEEALKVDNEQLREASLRDGLTGLYNRRFMEDALRREIVRARRHHRPLGVLLIDVDYFKRVNDTYGHAAGDVVLKAVSDYFVALVRREDIICRYGGEEFLILMPDMPIEVARQRAERLREGVRRIPIVYAGTSIGPITLSSGVAVFPDHAESEGNLLKAADDALYRAKNNGRDRVEVSNAIGFSTKTDQHSSRAAPKADDEIKVLLLEDDPNDMELEVLELQRAAFKVDAVRVDTEADFIRMLDEFEPDVILADFAIPGFGGMSALSIARSKSPDIPFIFVSGTIGEERAIESFKRGATDYVLKTNLSSRLVPVVKRALGESRERAARKKAEMDLLQQEEKIARLRRINTISSGINAITVKVRERQELFRQACRIAVEQGGFKMAWIGVAEPGGGKVLPIAWMGIDGGYLEEVHKTLRNVAEDNGAAGRALKEKRLVLANDIESSPQIVFKKEALSRGYRSLVALPLQAEGDVVAVMVLYAAQPDFFDEQELQLLGDLSADISFALDHIAKEEKLNYLSNYDVLTGLPNRTLFRDRLSQLVQTAKADNSNLAVVLIDLERFRNVNDTFGRVAGDELLKLVADRLSECMQDMTCLARIGGNSFAAVMTNAKDESAVAQLIEKNIFISVPRPLVMKGVELRIQPKAGIAVYPTGGPDADTLIINAETALKKAKDTAEKYIFYAPQMHIVLAEQLTLENRLRRAIEEEQFILHYQPKVSLSNKRITGIEALIRWQSPELGMVPPATFIPLLEETGLILDVGRWVLHKAAADYSALQATGINPPRIAINVSSLQLRQKRFVDEVINIVNANGKSAALDLEVTESVLMEDMEGTIIKLNRLREMGVGVALDDFGTGFCSMSYLVKLPVDTLKIDRSFIENVPDSKESIAIISAIVALAKSLNLTVVAEGVETAKQADLLRGLKCDEMQGYLFSRPVPLARIEELLRESWAKSNSQA